MRALVVLSLLSLAAAESAEQTGDCLVDSGEAVSDATDAALFIWAAAKRCGKKDMTIKCEVDVSSAVKSVNSMINVILKAVDKCDGLHTANKECGLEAGKLTKHVSGLAAAAGDVTQKCTAAKNAAGMKEYAAPVMCTIDIKDSLKQLFKAIKHIRRAHDECEDGKEDCATNALDIVSSFAGMGGYLAGAIGQCKRTTAVNKASKVASTRDELCAQASNFLIHHTLEVAESGVKLSQKCKASSRLFDLFDKKHDKKKKKKHHKAWSPITAMLGAFLPITAMVGFVGGRFYASRRPQIREVMSDVE